MGVTGRVNCRWANMLPLRNSEKCTITDHIWAQGQSHQGNTSTVAQKREGGIHIDFTVLKG